MKSDLLLSEHMCICERRWTSYYIHTRTIHVPLWYYILINVCSLDNSFLSGIPQFSFIQATLAMTSYSHGEIPIHCRDNVLSPGIDPTKGAPLFDKDRLVGALKQVLERLRFISKMWFYIVYYVIYIRFASCIVLWL